MVGPLHSTRFVFETIRYYPLMEMSPERSVNLLNVTSLRDDRVALTAHSYSTFPEIIFVFICFIILLCFTIVRIIQRKLADIKRTIRRFMRQPSIDDVVL
nr:protein m119.4 [Murid betaherpesvirus 2]